MVESIYGNAILSNEGNKESFKCEDFFFFFLLFKKNQDFFFFLNRLFFVLDLKPSGVEILPKLLGACEADTHTLLVNGPSWSQAVSPSPS